MDKTETTFQKRVHLMGRIGSLISIITFMTVGIVIAVHFNIVPPFIDILTAIIVIFVLLLVTGVIEFVSFLPILGSGATYISFITGNISNMKAPSVLSVMASQECESGSDEHEVLSIIAATVASLTVIILITIVVIFSDALRPALEYDIIQPAFIYIMPGIFGILLMGPLLKSIKTVLPALLIGIITAYLLQNNYVTLITTIAVSMILFVVLNRGNNNE